MAGYITRNANILLLLLILLCAGALVGATIYFQDRFGTINDEYTAKLTQLQNVSTTLEQYQGILSSTKEELELKGTREADLTTKYTDIKGLNDQLAADKAQLEDDKAKLQLTLAETSNRLTLSQNTVAERNAAITGLNKDIATLNGQIVTYKSDISHLNSKISCLRDTADASEGTC